MKLQTIFSTTLLFALMLFISQGTVQAQSSQEQARTLLKEMPATTTIRKLDPTAQKYINESISILKAAAKVIDGNSAEAKALDDRAEKLAVQVEKSASQLCKEGCLRARAACLAACGSDNLCRALCRSRTNWCIIRCHYTVKDPVQQGPQNEVPGGKK